MNSKRLIDMTIDELMEVISRHIDVRIEKMSMIIESKLNSESADKDGPLYGIEGMCKALHCSKTKVMKLKRDGDLNGAYQQIGGTIIVNDPQALRDAAAFADQKRRKKRLRVATKSIYN